MRELRGSSRPSGAVDGRDHVTGGGGIGSARGKRSQSLRLLLAGTHRLNQYASMVRPSTPAAILDRMALRDDAEKDLRGCLAVLQHGLIHRALLGAERRLNKQRREENPFHAPDGRRVVRVWLWANGGHSARRDGAETVR